MKAVNVKPLPLAVRRRRQQQVGSDGPRLTIRLRPRQDLRLRRMGRMEKRSVVEFVRAWLDDALTTWEAQHPPVRKFKTH